MPSPDPSSTAAWQALAGLSTFFWIFILGIIVLTIAVYWRIASKAGYSGVLSLLMLLPFVNIVMLLLFAFTEWPIEQEVRRLRGGPAAAPGVGTTMTPT